MALRQAQGKLGGRLRTGFPPGEGTKPRCLVTPQKNTRFDTHPVTRADTIVCYTILNHVTHTGMDVKWRDRDGLAGVTDGASRGAVCPGDQPAHHVVFLRMGDGCRGRDDAGAVSGPPLPPPRCARVACPRVWTSLSRLLTPRIPAEKPTHTRR
jgi:hypothetical protein